VNLKRLLSNTALISSLAFAAIGAGTLALGVGLIWRVLARENTAFVQQSIGDTAGMLATQSQLELERVSSLLGELGQERIKPMLLQQENEVRVMAENVTSPMNEALAAAAAMVTATNTVGTLDTEPDISDLSLWRKRDPKTPVVQVFLAMNPRFRSSVALSPAALQHSEAAIRPHLEAAFSGHIVVRAESHQIILVAVPLGHGEVSEVIAAHLSLDKLQRLFANDGFVQGALVDHEGRQLAGGAGLPLQPLFELASSLNLDNDQQTIRDRKGDEFFAGFRRVGVGNLTVLASVPVAQSAIALRGVRIQILSYLILVFTLFAIGRYAFLTRNKSPSFAPPPEEPMDEGPAQEPVLSAPEAVDLSGPRKLTVIALHGSLWGFNQILEASSAEETTDILNDYFTTMALRIRECDGNFERYPGVSFAATWEMDVVGMARALQCALHLRRDFAQWNESRKLDGKPTLSHGMGMHIGPALEARIGPASEMRVGVIGEALACARALDRLGLASGTELVISREVLKAADGSFAGSLLGEARLSAETGLTTYYAVEPDQSTAKILAFRKPGSPERLTGGETRLHIVTPETEPPRWQVNNGTQMVGPFTAKELAARLFSQELDFDCECWSEEKGRQAQISSANIFSGSNDEGAHLWVYDGQTVHGPVSEGFLRTAITRGAISEKSFVCEGSTIKGWRTVIDYLSPLKSTG
jgi:class 3 adenylate cyclase